MSMSELHIYWQTSSPDNLLNRVSEFLQDFELSMKDLSGEIEHASFRYERPDYDFMGEFDLLRETILEGFHYEDQGVFYLIHDCESNRVFYRVEGDGEVYSGHFALKDRFYWETMEKLGKVPGFSITESYEKLCRFDLLQDYWHLGNQTEGALMRQVLCGKGEEYGTGPYFKKELTYNRIIESFRGLNGDSKSYEIFSSVRKMNFHVVENLRDYDDLFRYGWDKLISLGRHDFAFLLSHTYLTQRQFFALSKRDIF